MIRYVYFTVETYWINLPRIQITYFQKIHYFCIQSFDWGKEANTSTITFSNREYLWIDCLQSSIDILGNWSNNWMRDLLLIHFDIYQRQALIRISRCCMSICMSLEHHCSLHFLISWHFNAFHSRYKLKLNTILILEEAEMRIFTI